MMLSIPINVADNSLTIIFFKDIDTMHGDFLDVDPSDPAYMKVCRSLLNFVKSDNIV